MLVAIATLPLRGARRGSPYGGSSRTDGAPNANPPAATLRAWRVSNEPGPKPLNGPGSFGSSHRAAASIGPCPDVVPGALECICRQSGPDSVWVHVRGDLDVATSPLLEQTLRGAELLSRRVVLDLRELTFMDPSSAHVIVDASERARLDKRRLMLVRGPARVDRVLTLTEAANVLEIADL